MYVPVAEQACVLQCCIISTRLQVFVGGKHVGGCDGERTAAGFNQQQQQQLYQQRQQQCGGIRGRDDEAPMAICRWGSCNYSSS
jgi:hypothetical protein